MISEDGVDGVVMKPSVRRLDLSQDAHKDENIKNLRNISVINQIFPPKIRLFRSFYIMQYGNILNVREPHDCICLAIHRNIADQTNGECIEI